MPAEGDRPSSRSKSLPPRYRRAETRAQYRIARVSAEFPDCDFEGIGSRRHLPKPNTYDFAHALCHVLGGHGMHHAFHIVRHIAYNPYHSACIAHAVRYIRCTCITPYHTVHLIGRCVQSCPSTVSAGIGTARVRTDRLCLGRRADAS